MTTAISRPSVPAVTVAPQMVQGQIAPAGAHRARLTRVLSAVAAVAALTYLAVTSWPALVASLATLTHLKVGWVGPLLSAQFVSMAAPALVHHRLLQVRGAPVGVRTLLGITYASNALSVSLPLAGPEIATGYSFRQLLRRGVDSAAAGWTLLISGFASALTFTLLVIGSAAATGSSAAAVLAVGTSLLIGAAAAGLLLYGTLCRPTRSAPFPMIIHVHGGPVDVTTS